VIVAVGWCVLVFVGVEVFVSVGTRLPGVPVRVLVGVGEKVDEGVKVSVGVLPKYADTTSE
jgi:hypothetical protein